MLTPLKMRYLLLILKIQSSTNKFKKWGNLQKMSSQEKFRKEMEIKCPFLFFMILRDGIADTPNEIIVPWLNEK
jgi:hypothetical protein